MTVGAWVPFVGITIAVVVNTITDLIHAPLFPVARPRPPAVHARFPTFPACPGAAATCPSRAVLALPAGFAIPTNTHLFGGAQLAFVGVAVAVVVGSITNFHRGDGSVTILPLARAASLSSCAAVRVAGPCETLVNLPVAIVVHPVALFGSATEDDAGGRRESRVAARVGKPEAEFVLSSGRVARPTKVDLDAYIPTGRGAGNLA